MARNLSPIEDCCQEDCCIIVVGSYHSVTFTHAVGASSELSRWGPGAQRWQRALLLSIFDHLVVLALIDWPACESGLY
jgi:hypothetical protein